MALNLAFPKEAEQSHSQVKKKKRKTKTKLLEWMTIVEMRQ